MNALLHRPTAEASRQSSRRRVFLIFIIRIQQVLDISHKLTCLDDNFPFEDIFQGLKMQNLLTPVTNKLPSWKSVLLGGRAGQRQRQTKHLVKAPMASRGHQRALEMSHKRA